MQPPGPCLTALPAAGGQGVGVLWGSRRERSWVLGPAPNPEEAHLDWEPLFVLFHFVPSLETVRVG